MFDKSSSERREFQVFLDDLVAVYVAFAIPYLLTPLIGLSTSIYNVSSVMLSPRRNNDTFDSVWPESSYKTCQYDASICHATRRDQP